MIKEKLKCVKRKINFSIFFFILIIFLISIKNEEIKRVMDLLKDETSDHIGILDDLYKLLGYSLVFNLLNILYI